jgi:hypothetical protein
MLYLPFGIRGTGTNELMLIMHESRLNKQPIETKTVETQRKKRLNASFPTLNRANRAASVKKFYPPFRGVKVSCYAPGVNLPKRSLRMIEPLPL